MANKIFFEQLNNVSRPVLFRKTIAAGDKGCMEAELAAHGVVKRVRVRFAAGENGTLHVRPQAIIPQEIAIDLLQYAEGGDKYISGDDETYEVDCKVEIENHAKIRVWYDNTGSAASFLDVDVEVEYFAIVEPENIIGPRRGV